jgi:hypothetical protein
MWRGFFNIRRDFTLGDTRTPRTCCGRGSQVPSFVASLIAWPFGIAAPPSFVGEAWAAAVSFPWRRPLTLFGGAAVVCIHHAKRHFPNPPAARYQFGTDCYV